MVGQGINVNKTTDSRECVICPYSYFLKINLRFQSEACDDCHDLMQKVMSFSNATIVSVKGSYYRMHFSYQ